MKTSTSRKIFNEVKKLYQKLRLGRFEPTVVFDSINDVLADLSLEPLNVILKTDTLCFKGWALNPKSPESIKAVYLEIDGQSYLANYGSERLDVLAAHQNRRYQYCGFELGLSRRQIQTGLHRLTIRAISDQNREYVFIRDYQWQLFQWHYHIDSVAEVTLALGKTVAVCCPEKIINVKGWAADQFLKGPPENACLLLDGTPYRLEFRQERKDVLKVLGKGFNRHLGFEVGIPAQTVSEGTHLLSLRISSSGDRVLYEPEQTFKFQLQKNPYALWLKENSVSQKRLNNQRTRQFSYSPRISIIVPTVKAEPKWLTAMIDSVISQTYRNWELCIADGGSEDPEIIEVIRQYARQYGQMKVSFLKKNYGIAGNTNQAMRLARGEFLAFLDHDDLLSPEALFEIVSLLNSDPKADVIYTDSDKIDEDGVFCEPFFKPAWSPEYFRGVMYIGHLLVVRQTVAAAAGQFDPHFDGVQDYEWMLRVSERTQQIRHLPQILYHWRKREGSIAKNPNSKGNVGELQEKAVNQHLRRLKIRSKAEAMEQPHRIRLVPLKRKTFPRVSVIIPSRDQSGFLNKCLLSLYEKSTYPNFEVVIVDNETTEVEALKIIQQFPVVSVKYPDPFNYSRANNLGVRHCQGSILVFLNNDVEILTPDWIEQLLNFTEQPDIGAVGPLLLYPDDTVQHAGVALGFRGTADHLMRGFPGGSDGYAGSLSATRETSAVTAACLMVKKIDFEQVGFFNEHYAIIYQDVDLCLKLRHLGKRNIFTPNAKLYHHESRSRKTGNGSYNRLDRLLLLDQWQAEIDKGDPYYNPNFTLLEYERHPGDYWLKFRPQSRLQDKGKAQ